MKLKPGQKGTNGLVDVNGDTSKNNKGTFMIGPGILVAEYCRSGTQNKCIQEKNIRRQYET